MGVPSQPQTERYVERVRAACEALLGAAGASRVSVWTHDQRSDAVSPLVAVGEEVPATHVARRWSRLPVSELGRLGQVLVDRRPVLVEDMDAAVVPTAMFRDFGMSSAWVGPLAVGDQTLGLLVVEPLTTVGADLDGHLDAVATAVSEARAWYLAERRQAELDLLLDLTRSGLEPRDDGGAIEHLCQHLAQHLQVARACVFLADDGHLTAVHAHYADGSVDRDRYRAFSAAPPPAVVEEVFRTRATMVLDEPVSGAADQWWLDTFEVGSAVAVPIGTTAAPLGVLVLDDPRPRRFTGRVLALAEAAATHFGLLYERARLLDDQARAMRAAGAVRHLLREGSAARSLLAGFEVVARVGLGALEAEHAIAVVLDDDGRIGAVETVGIDEPWATELKRRSRGLRALEIPLGRRLIEGRSPVVVVDADRDDQIPPELLEGMLVRSYVAMPLATSSRVRGVVLFTSSTTQRRWSRADRMLIEQLVLECELVVENAALRESEAQQARELSWRALHDPLTGLPNRALLDDRLATALRATARRGGHVAVLFVDLYRFKEVNDTFGHEVGDRVLVALAERLSTTVRSDDTVGRLAGDEFLVVLPDAEHDDAVAVAARICEAVAAPARVGLAEVAVGASIGVALGDHTEEAAAVVRRADAAMYRAKRQHGHGYLATDLPATVDRDL